MIRILLIVVALWPTLCQASCFEKYGQQFGVDPALLKALAWQESRGHKNAVGVPLKDGNVALGAMQINTIHLPALRQYGISREDLFNGCKSVHIGAWVFANCVRSVGEERAIGCYYAGPKAHHSADIDAYVASVKSYYAKYRAEQPHTLTEAGSGALMVVTLPTNSEKRDVSEGHHE